MNEFLVIIVIITSSFHKQNHVQSIVIQQPTLRTLVKDTNASSLLVDGSNEDL